MYTNILGLKKHSKKIIKIVILKNKKQIISIKIVQSILLIP